MSYYETFEMFPGMPAPFQHPSLYLNGGNPTDGFAHYSQMVKDRMHPYHGTYKD